MDASCQHRKIEWHHHKEGELDKTRRESQIDILYHMMKNGDLVNLPKIEKIEAGYLNK